MLAFLLQVAPAAADVRPEEMQARPIEARLELHYPERYAPAAKQLEEVAPKTVRAVAKRLELEHLGDVQVWVLPEVDDYFEVTNNPGRLPDWAIGLSLSDKGVIIVVNGAGPNGQLVDLEKTFVHELAHVAIDRARAGKPIPRWFNEGFALMTAEEWTPERADTLAKAAAAGTLRSFRNLDEGFPAHSNSASIAYSQSFHFVKHLEQLKGPKVYGEIARHVREGKSFEDAFRIAMGASLAVIEAKWRKDLEASMSGWSVLNDGTWGFFLGALMFLAAFIVRRKRSQNRLANMKDEPGAWDYDEARYPLPGSREP